MISYSCTLFYTDDAHTRSFLFSGLLNSARFGHLNCTQNLYLASSCEFALPILTMRFQLTQYFETTIFVQLKNFSDFSIDDYFRGLDEFVSIMDIY